MRKNRLPTTEPGVYVFRAPAKVFAEIDDQLITVFVSPLHRACGFVVAPTVCDRRHLTDLLDTVWAKLTKEFGPLDPALQIKIFGCREPSTPVLRTIENWMKQRGLRITARDTGRGVSRSLQIDCGTGQVGVQYAESIDSLVYLQPGSARQRLQPDGAQSQMLVLSESPVRRTLAQKAIEEHRNWIASLPPETSPVLRDTRFKKTNWSAVLISDDVQERKKLETWLTKLQSARPFVRRFWSGDQLPPFAGPTCQLRQLPPLDAENIDLFKQELTSALTEEHHDSPTQARVIPFRSGKKKKKA